MPSGRLHNICAHLTNALADARFVQPHLRRIDPRFAREGELVEAKIREAIEAVGSLQDALRIHDSRPPDR